MDALKLNLNKNFDSDESLKCKEDELFYCFLGSELFVSEVIHIPTQHTFQDPNYPHEWEELREHV